jgi:O-antigen ligase
MSITADDLDRTAMPAGLALGRESFVHALSLKLVWLTMALAAIVLFEPAPIDAMLMGLMILLPAIGLAQFDKITGFYCATWLIICAGGFISAIWAIDLRQANTHIGITLYLSMASVVLAAFVRTDPLRHIRIIEAGLIFAGAVASITALIGIFNLVPGAGLFVLYDRATGTFKDPNVMSAFMVVPITIALQRVTEPGLLRRISYGALMLVMTLALIMSLSRGAYFSLLVSVLSFFYLRFISARAVADRLNLLLLVAAGIAVAVLIGMAALSFDRFGDLMASRLGAQAYDTGEQGRFAGQRIALTVIAEHPFGIGPLQFEPQFHAEVPHQVYLSMFLHSGWIGGFAFLLLCLATLFFGFRHTLRSTPVQSSLIVFVGCWCGLVAESFIIDSDHWRHLFIVLAVIWGIIASAQYQRPLMNQSMATMPPQPDFPSAGMRRQRASIRQPTPLPSSPVRYGRVRLGLER